MHLPENHSDSPRVSVVEPDRLSVKSVVAPLALAVSTLLSACGVAEKPHDGSGGSNGATTTVEVCKPDHPIQGPIDVNTGSEANQACTEIIQSYAECGDAGRFVAVTCGESGSSYSQILTCAPPEGTIETLVSEGMVCSARFNPPYPPVAPLDGGDVLDPYEPDSGYKPGETATQDGGGGGGN